VTTIQESGIAAAFAQPPSFAFNESSPWDTTPRLCRHSNLPGFRLIFRVLRDFFDNCCATNGWIPPVFAETHGRIHPRFQPRQFKGKAMPSFNMQTLMCLVLALMTGTSRIPPESATQRIRGVLPGYVSLAPISLPDLIFQVNYHANGRVQPLGKTRTDFISPEVHVDLANRQLIATEPTWFVNLVAANGDEIHGIYTFSSGVIDFDALGFFAITADVEIVGGTGRFAGKAGSAQSFAVGNIFLGTFVIAFEGEIQ
jgi:hypothetical protein